MKIKYLIVAFIVLTACENYPDRVRTSLQQARDNRQQLEEVIRHYNKSGEKEKVEAAYFLIANMKDKGSYYNDLVDAEGKSVGFNISDFNNTEEENVWLDSVKAVRGPLHIYENYELDLTHITSDFLINNIDRAFEVKQESPFCQGISDHDFYEYVLPYRVGYERLEDWRGSILNEFAELKDSIYGFSTLLAATNFIDNYFQRCFWYGGGRYFKQRKMRCYSELRHDWKGKCDDMCNLVIFGLRALGVPSGYDGVNYKQAWDGVGHGWCFVLDAKTGKNYPFDALSENGPGLFNCPNPNSPKVMRTQFAIQENSVKNDPDQIHPALYRDYSQDVTSEYFETVNISISLKHECTYPVYLSIWFRGVWVPIDYFEDTKPFERVSFSHVSKDNLYCLTSYIHSANTEEGEPFVINRYGEIVYEQSLGIQESVSLNEYQSAWFQNANIGDIVYKFGAGGDYKVVCKKVKRKNPENGQSDWLFAPDSVRTNCFYYLSDPVKSHGRIFVLDNDKKNIHWY